MADAADEKTIYRLVLNVAATNFRDKIVLEDEDRLNLEPLMTERGNYTYERYGEDDDFVEIRHDYVVVRSLNSVVIDKAVDTGIDTGIGAASDRDFGPPQFGTPDERGES